jgi:hypothetical protein
MFRIALTVILVCTPAIGQQSTLTGSVTDSEGAAVSRALIIIHWDSSGSEIGLRTNVGTKEDAKVATNREGQFSIELPPGFYDVFVTSPSFSPNCRKIRILPARRTTFTAKLSADPIVTKELGDGIHD